MATDDRNGGFRGILLPRVLRREGLSTYNVKRGHAEETLGVEDASILEDSGGDGNGAVDGVGDNQGECLGAELGNAFDESLDNAGIDFKEVVAGHAWFTYAAC